MNKRKKKKKTPTTVMVVPPPSPPLLYAFKIEGLGGRHQDTSCTYTRECTDTLAPAGRRVGHGSRVSGANGLSAGSRVVRVSKEKIYSRYSLAHRRQKLATITTVRQRRTSVAGTGRGRVKAGALGSGMS